MLVHQDVGTRQVAVYDAYVMNCAETNSQIGLHAFELTYGTVDHWLPREAVIRRVNRVQTSGERTYIQS